MINKLTFLVTKKEFSYECSLNNWKTHHKDSFKTHSSLLFVGAKVFSSSINPLKLARLQAFILGVHCRSLFGYWIFLACSAFDADWYGDRDRNVFARVRLNNPMVISEVGTWNWTVPSMWLGCTLVLFSSVGCKNTAYIDSEQHRKTILAIMEM